jgi:hypothetical protein
MQIKEQAVRWSTFHDSKKVSPDAKPRALKPAAIKNRSNDLRTESLSSTTAIIVLHLKPLRSRGVAGPPRAWADALFARSIAKPIYPPFPVPRNH